ncbi:hypothetical protein NC651_028404 [Populus alba x Populus x berolinensis]|nr:hypothetical protein NC651_028404 [Populus alba x Populus x berolinensis]
MSKHQAASTASRQKLGNQRNLLASYSMFQSTGLVNSSREAKQKFEERISGKKKMRRHDQ